MALCEIHISFLKNVLADLLAPPPCETRKMDKDAAGQTHGPSYEGHPISNETFSIAE